MTLAFRVVGIARSMGSKRAFIPKGWKTALITDSNRSLKAWQSLVASAAGAAIQARGSWQLLDGPVRLSLAFYLPRPQAYAKKPWMPHTKAPDLDKLARGGIDSLSGIVFHDDAQIVELVAGKFYAAPGAVPHCDVKVETTVGVALGVVPTAPAPLFQTPLFAETR
jgi:Holliday junction resolvase RusA-like endonuclease